MARNRKNTATSMPLAPAGGIIQRFSFTFFIVVAVGLLALSFVQPTFGERLRAEVTDVFAPILSFVASPVKSVTGAISSVANVTELRAENERLQAENSRLREYQTAAMRLEAENKGLRGLLNMQADPAQQVVTARVIADVGGPFVRNVIVTAGQKDGVRAGLVAMAEGGLAGRVISSGTNSSRILLINDINARIPVLLEGSRVRGMVAGNNTPELELMHLPPGAQVKAGDRLITSGAGGLFPPGLPVGAVMDTKDGKVRVVPLANLDQLEILQITDPGTPKDLLTPESTQPLANTSPKAK